MIINLVQASWLGFFLSALGIISGALILIKTGENIGLYITYSGFIGLALSGLLMTITYDVLW